MRLCRCATSSGTAEENCFSLSVDFGLRELICPDGTILSERQTILSEFPRLRALSIDNHDDVRCHATGMHPFAYRDVISSLPRSLLYLEIKHAHGPDANIIALVKRCCPDLETLWLGRCTMFNRTPACEFWTSFPFDHDSYISNEGTDAYAVGQPQYPSISNS